ncbi:MAG: lipocalin family protein [Defluviitaleaceae bacterium]|nr:lipocalin family protein [Defluviitaleaceae bacterium]
MGKKIALVVFVVMSLMMLVMLVGCGGNSESRLVGTWEMVSMEIIIDGESHHEYAEGERMEFFSDGNGAMVDGMGHITAFTWTAENGRLMTTIQGLTNVQNYRISGSTLTTTNTVTTHLGTIETTAILRRAR